MREGQNNQACGARARFQAHQWTQTSTCYWSLCVKSTGVCLSGSFSSPWSKMIWSKTKVCSDILRMINWYYCHAFYCYYEQKDLKFKFFMSCALGTHKKKLILIKCFKYGDVKKWFRSSVLKSWRMHFEFCSLKNNIRLFFFFAFIKSISTQLDYVDLGFRFCLLVLDFTWLVWMWWE